ncbi:MAG: MAPEG family protein, partial [Pseudomonadota bacterium]
MSPELTVLTLAALLQVVQFMLYAVPANLELGTDKTLGPRDDPNLAQGLTTTTQRMKRAMENHFEGLALFTIAVVVVTLGEKNSSFTAFCAHAYLVARILYIPAYASGAVPWRSLIWTVGFLATLAMLIAALL